MLRGGQGRPETIASAAGGDDGGDLRRDNSLLPGEVRTPTMVVTLSDAWGEGSADWAAPGSSVWEEEAPSRHSTHTPLNGYDQSDVWASATGTPLMGDDLIAQASFGRAEADLEEPVPDAAELVAVTLNALVPEQHRDVNAQALQMGPAVHQLERPQYTDGGVHTYQSRYGAVQVTPVATVAELAHLYSQPHQQPPPQQPSYFTVQEGPSTAAAMFAARSPSAPSAGSRASHPGGQGGLPGQWNPSYVPRLEDAAVSQSIIASAGLPLSMNSLVDYIHGGQPRAQAYTTALGTTRNAARNYPNLNEPPAEEETAYGGRGGHAQRGGYGQASQGPRWGSPAEGGFAVRGRDTIGSAPPQTATSPTPPSSYGGGGGFVVSAGGGAAAAALRTPGGHGGHGNGGAGRHKSESEYLSDLLHFHANFFPPPPPPRVPKDERRTRAELWYHYASKWDITHRLPPPPRTPLPEMELEYRMRLQQMTRVPYHGDGWLHMGERWFDVTQALFDFPEENIGDEVDFNVVLQQAVLG